MRSSSRPRYPPPIVLPAERPDIPELVRIYLDAESGNLLYNLMMGSRKKFGRELIKIFEDNFDNPQLLLMKAVDPDSGDITAMAAWQLQGYTPEELKSSRSDAASKVFPPLRLHAGVFHGRIEGKPLPGLGQYVNDQLISFLNDWTTDLKHLYLALLMTDPQYQRRGIGTAMLKWGHEKSDKDRVPAVLIASPVGHPLYLSMGWKEVSTPIQIELKDWVPYAKYGDQGWGMYKFYCHLRLPKTIL